MKRYLKSEYTVDLSAETNKHAVDKFAKHIEHEAESGRKHAHKIHSHHKKHHK